MDKVKRYAMMHNLAVQEHLVSSMQEWSDGPLAGDWVKYEDYEKLKKSYDKIIEAGNSIEQQLRAMNGDYPRCLANEWAEARGLD